MKEPIQGETAEVAQTESTRAAVVMDFSSPPPFRYTNAQKNHTLIHPSLPQPSLVETTVTTAEAKKYHKHSPSPIRKQHAEKDVQEEEEDVDNDADESSFFFIVCADTQLGMTRDNRDWQEEIAYSRQAVTYMNQMDPAPLFCCVCGMCITKSNIAAATHLIF
jgi:hypothetical protein